MTIRRMIIATVSTLTLIGAAHADELAQADELLVYADELKPTRPQKFDLGEVSGIAYYTVERDGFHVVATLAQDNAGTPIRFQATLAPGQSVVFSTPREIGVAPLAVEISRQGNEVIVAKAPTN
jgi:hypothetical protein